MLCGYSFREAVPEDPNIEAFIEGPEARDGFGQEDLKYLDGYIEEKKRQKEIRIHIK